MLMQTTMSSGKYIRAEPYDDCWNYSMLDGNGTMPALTGKSDYGTHVLRYVAEVCFSLPIAVLGIVGNIVSFIILCRQRRHNLLTVTILLQVCAAASILVQ